MDRRRRYCTARRPSRRPWAARGRAPVDVRGAPCAPPGASGCRAPRVTSTLRDEPDLPERRTVSRTAMSTDYSRALGARLRAIRNQQGLSLQGVEDKSHGRWKAVVVCSYGGDDRAVTVQRLSELPCSTGPVPNRCPPGRAPPSRPTGNRAEPRVAGLAARRRGRSAGPLRLDHQGSAPRRHGRSSIRTRTSVAGDHLRMSPTS